MRAPEVHTHAGYLIRPADVNTTKFDAGDYDSRFRAEDPNKTAVHGQIVDHIKKQAPTLRHALVLDCRTFNTSCCLRGHFPRLKRGGIVVVNRDSKMPTNLKPTGVRVERGIELVEYLKQTRTTFDFMFLDHCGAFETEKACLDVALQRKLVSGVLAATYCIRGNGPGITKDRLIEMVRAFVQKRSVACGVTCRELSLKHYNSMVVFIWKVS